MKRTQPEKPAPLPVLAFYTHKGGVAKTTTLLAVAARAVQAGLRVCVIDCDPQMNASAFLARGAFDFEALYAALLDHYVAQRRATWERSEADKRTIAQFGLAHRNIRDLLVDRAINASFADILAKKAQIGYDVTGAATHAGITLIASHPMLATLDQMLASEVYHRHANLSAMFGLLCEHMVRARGHDLVLLDLSPSNSLFNQMALMASSAIVSPLTGDRFSALSLRTLGLTLDLARENFSAALELPPPRLCALVYTRYEAGDVALRSAGRDYRVTAQHAAYIEAIRGALRSPQLTQWLAPGSDAAQMPLVRDAPALSAKLQHASLTPLDNLADAGLSAEELTQAAALRDEYEALWERVRVTLGLPVAVLDLCCRRCGALGATLVARPGLAAYCSARCAGATQ